GELYAVNTLGAMLGTVLAGFFLIEILGLTGTLWIGALCTATAALFALILDRRSPLMAHDRGSLVGATAQHSPIDDPDDHRKVEANWRLALSSAFVMGLTSLGYQVLWTRMLSSGTGNTTYVFTLILFIFLFGIAFGANLIGRLPARPAHSVALLGVAVLALAGVALISGRIVSLSFVPMTVLVVLPTTIVLGLALPLASCLVGKGDDRVGRDVGFLLGANTIGVVIGTSAVPFVLVPL